MKWSGWVCAVFVLFGILGVNNSNTKQQARAKAAAAEQLASKRKVAEEPLDRLVAGFPKIAKQTADYDADLKKSQARKLALELEQKAAEKEVAEVNGSIDAVENQKADQRTKRQGTTQDIKALQGKVNAEQQNIAKLKENLLRVTESSPAGGAAE